MVFVIGERLREARKAKGLTQEELGSILGVTGAAVSGYERDERIPDPDILVRLATALDVSVDWLLGRTNQRYPAEIMTIMDSDDAQEYLGKLTRTSTGLIFTRLPLPPRLNADSSIDDWTEFLSDAIARSGVPLTTQDRRQIAEAAAAVVAILTKQKMSKIDKKQVRKQDKYSTT